VAQDGGEVSEMGGADIRRPPVDAFDLLEAISDGFYALSSGWRFTYVNRHVERITGRSRDQLLGLNVWELFPHAVGSDFWQAHQDVMRERRPIEIRTRSMAVDRSVAATLKPTADGGICILFRDLEDELLAKARLDTTEAQLRLVLESTNDGFFAVDADWRFVLFNAACEKFFGRPREEVLGRQLWDVISVARGTEIQSKLEAVVASGEPAEFDFPSVVAPGRTIEIHAAPMAGGGLAILFSDVTARKQAEEALAASEARLRDITDAMPVLISYVDAEERFRFANAAYEGRFRRPREQIIGRTLTEVFGEALYKDRRPFVARALAGEHVTYEVEFPRGEEVLTTLVEHIPHRAPDGRVLGFYSLVQDVTGLKSAQAALQANEQALRELNETLERQVAARTAELAESERRFRGIFDSALQFMALLTPEGLVVEVNQTALRWSQIRPADIVGRPFWLASPMRDNPELQAAIESGIRRAAAGQVVREEHVMRGAGTVVATVDFSLKPVTDEAGQVLWLVAEGRDISELKLAQEQLRQSQKMEAIGQLTGGIAHDFNNLLTIIRSSADLLRRHDLEETKRRRYVDAISDTADRAAELTSQLLSFARRQALKPVVFDVAERIREITRMIHSVVGSRIRVETELTDAACYIEADRSQFETALINMAVNARDAMDGEGRLTIGLRRAYHVPRASRRGGGEFVAVSVADTGHGIPGDQVERIFEPFFTTKEVGKGTGLGLSQVYGFAKQSGGEVAVESAPGEGATFTLYLPLTDKQPDAGPAPARAGALGPASRRARILVVEDNASVGEFARQLLHDFGYETVWASHAAEALERLENDGAFDLVFSDVVMPGMSGVELAAELRKRWPTVPIVLTTGYSDTLADQGAQGFELLRKPYSVEALSHILRRVLH
jgi:PAS domain S-box-containing protein